LKIRDPVLIGEDDEPKTIPTISVKMIIPVASLKDDSISTIVESNRGTFSILNVFITIAASVGEINAAKINAIEKGKCSKYISKKPTAKVVITTPIVARSNDPRKN
jgi:hypothetical protein